MYLRVCVSMFTVHNEQATLILWIMERCCDSVPVGLLTGPEGIGGRHFGGSAVLCHCVNEGVADGADGDPVFLHLCSQTVKERLDGMLGRGI